MGINMRVLILTGTLLLVQLSQQAAVPEAAEVAFPDGNVEEVAAKDYDYYVYGYPYYLCKCSFEEYEEYWGVASVDVDTEETAWCPCFQYDSYEYQGWSTSTPTRRTGPARLARTGTSRGRRSITPPAVWRGRRRARNIITEQSTVL